MLNEAEHAERARRLAVALDHPEQREPALTHGHVLLGLSARPSRGPVSYAWVVVGVPRVSPVVVREVAVPHHDPQRFTLRDVEVKPSVIYRALQQAQSLPIPILLLDLPPMGLDGTTFTVRMNLGSAAVSVRFRSGEPEPWGEFAAWTKATMRLLHECVAPGESLELDL